MRRSAETPLRRPGKKRSVFKHALCWSVIGGVSALFTGVAWAAALNTNVIIHSSTNTVLQFSTGRNTNTAPGAARTTPLLFGDPVVARGKGFQITRSQLDEAFIAYRLSLAAQGQNIPESYRPKAESLVLERMINVQVLLARATDADKAKAQEVRDRLFAEYQKTMPSPESFNRQLIAWGMPPEKFRAHLYEEAIFRQVIDREVKARIVLEDATIRKFYEENPDRFDQPDRVRVSHILFLTQNLATRQELSEDQQREKRTLADKIHARAKAGEDFAQLAKEYSDDPVTRDRGSELPMLARGRMDPEFEQAAFQLQPGQISEVVTNRAGFHIIKLLEKYAARKVPFAEAEPEIREYLVTQETDKRLPGYMKQLRTEAGVEIPGEP